MKRSSNKLYVISKWPGVQFGYPLPQQRIPNSVWIFFPRKSQEMGQKHMATEPLRDQM